MTRNRLPMTPPPAAMATIGKVMATEVAQDLVRSATEAQPQTPVALMILQPGTDLHAVLSTQLLAEDPAYWGAELAEQADAMRAIGLPPLALIPVPSQVLVGLLEHLTHDHAQRATWQHMVQRERCVVCLADTEGMLVLPLSSRSIGVN